MTLEQIAKLGKIEPNNENLEILSYYKTACHDRQKDKAMDNTEERG